jgi:hypothetical protein
MMLALAQGNRKMLTYLPQNDIFKEKSLVKYGADNYRQNKPYL